MELVVWRYSRRGFKALASTQAGRWLAFKDRLFIDTSKFRTQKFNSPSLSFIEFKNTEGVRIVGQQMIAADTIYELRKLLD